MQLNHDAAAERAVLAGLCRYGSDVYLDICDMVKVDTFSINSNQIVFKCLDQILKNGGQVDLPSILSAANEIGLTHVIERKEEAQHLGSILALEVDEQNVRRFAAKIRKLEVTRLLINQMHSSVSKLAEINGTESVAHILSIAEDSIFNFTSLLDDGSESAPISLSDGILDRLKYLEENPVDHLGVSTGFPEWDAAIGGGLRPATLNVIAARPKTGKTVLTDNMGYFISASERGESQIPVLNLDTEMTLEDHQDRTTAMISGVEINDIATGNFGSSPDLRKRVYDAGNLIKSSKYEYKSIAGKPFEDQVSIMRRWIHKKVGLNADGTAKPCVIIYDYLKLMDAQGISSDMKEYQLLGFMMTTLHNFSVRYKVPFIVLMQLNRDGITKETTDIASGSDRIVWLCSNFTIFKHKSDEEIAADPLGAGNMKLVPLASRHGGGLGFGDYINCNMNGFCARITENGTKLKLADTLGDEEGFITDDEDDIPFTD